MVFVGRLCAAFSVYDKRLLDVVDALASSEIVDHFTVVAMSRKSLYLSHLRSDSMVVSEDADKAQRRVLYACTERRRCAVAHNQDGGSGIVDMISDVVLDSSCLQHSRRRDDDARLFALVERLGIAQVGDISQGVEAEWIRVEPHGVAYLLVERVSMAAENLGGIGREWGIHIDGYTL